VIVNRPIVAERIFLRSLKDADASDSYLAWMNDVELIQFLESRFRKFTRADLRQFIAACNEDADVLLLGIFRQVDERHIGNIKIGPINRHHMFGDIGILIGDREAWGQGFAREAIKALMKYVIGVIGLHKATAGCYVSNVGSRKAFLAAGFVEEGVLRKHYRLEDRWEDAILLAWVADDQ
jgi:ribosomal-protein-alanine N-acetyltransferase